MRWTRRNHEPPSVSSLNGLLARDEAFFAAHQALAARMQGQSEDEARAAFLLLMQEHKQRLSPTEVELWTLEIVDPDWAAKDPDRLARLMEQLSAEPSED